MRNLILKLKAKESVCGLRNASGGQGQRVLRIAKGRLTLELMLSAIVRRYAKVLCPPIPKELEREILVTTPEQRLPWESEVIEKMALWREEVRVACSTMQAEISALLVGLKDQSEQTKDRAQSYEPHREAHASELSAQPVHDTAEEYDAVISFANEDSDVASTLARHLRERSLRVFANPDEASLDLGLSLHEHFSRIYFQSSCCIVLVSSAYIRKSWTVFETGITAARSRTDPRYLLLPVRIDESPLPEALSAIVCLDLHRSTMAAVADTIAKTIKGRYVSPARQSKAKPAIHLIPRGQGWAVKRALSQRASRVFPNRDEALTYGKQLLSKTVDGELVVHRHDGSVAERVHRDS